MSSIRICKPGLLTTVQDLGRYGYQQFGMPVAGAMDSYSLKLANWLVGNSEGEACLEATATGPEIEFLNDMHIAISGGNMQPKVNNNWVGMYTTITVKSGDKLTYGELKSGFRTYIAFAGGIDVPMVMGSKSTYLRARIGGFNGRALQTGDIVELGNCNKRVEMRKATPYQIPVYKNDITVRIVPGPEAHYFTVNGLATFLNSTYTLTSQCDRMGYRLEGEKIELKLSADIISSGIAFGTIQVPAHGQPIIMMADRQTTGGYPRIANVITADLPLLAQLQEGDTVIFEEVNLEQAHSLL